MSYENIPAELIQEKAWVNVWNNSKIPMQSTVRKAASSTLPDTWSYYIDAEKNVQHGYYDGLGYVFHDTGLVGIDIDAGFDDGFLARFRRGFTSLSRKEILVTHADGITLESIAGSFLTGGINTFRIR